MTQRVFNFSAGPALLPERVLRQAKEKLLSLPGVGMSILEISHRSEAFVKILEEAEANLRQLLAVPDNYAVLFLQGGSRLQFSMTAMNLLRGTGRQADYLVTGSWGKKAVEEAVREGPVHVAYDGSATNYATLPDEGELSLSPDAAYVHFTSNETIQGVQFSREPNVGDAPLVCDASSDFLSRPLDISQYGLLYACAQKNAGPAGVTVVILDRELLSRCDDTLPGYLNYRNHAENNSMWNTPPTFAIYLLNLVTRWLIHEVGGLQAMAERNFAQAHQLYQTIDDSGGFYEGHANIECRSMMNVPFRLPDDQLTEHFITEAAEQGLHTLRGHRSVGGIRASIYNAMPDEGVTALCEFMKAFAKQYG